MGGRRLPDEHEAAVGATVAAANAAELLGDADTLAAADRYGSALSLTVLAFEESVKARTLGAITAAAVQGRRPGFSDDDLKKIIYNSHQARHAAGFVQHLAAAFPNVYGKLMLGIAITPAEVAALRELAELLATVNAGKQSGFYTDFDPESGSWIAPGSATKAEFEKTRTLIGDYVAETRRQIDEFMSFRRTAAG